MENRKLNVTETIPNEETHLQNELENLQIRFDLVSKSSSEGLWDMTYPANGELLPETPFWWSDQFRQLLGYTDVKDFPNILDSWASRLHPDEKDKTFAAFAAHLGDKTGQTDYNIEYRCKLKSGEYRWFRAQGYTSRDKLGNPLRVAGSLKDIHDEKKRAAELNESLVRFDLVSKSSSEGLWDMTYPANGELLPETPFWWSDQFRQLLGYTDVKDFPNILDSWASRLHIDEKDKTFAAFAAHLGDKTGRTGYDIEYRCKLKSGEYRWFRAKGYTSRDKLGNPLRVAGSLKDIHDEKELEKQIDSLVNRFTTQTFDIAEKTATVSGSIQTLSTTTVKMNASIDELNKTIHSIAMNAKNTDGVAQSAQQEAELGAKSMEKAAEAMVLISKSSDDISEIVKVIGEIANQTNLLAFNAAIEAARAGEHGLGFSVVADEVRKLAEKSAQATREISKLITESGRRIDQGSEISRVAGDAFTKILTTVKRTTQAIAEVATAAEEQLSAAKDISLSVQQVSNQAEKSHQATQEIVNATKSLNQGADELNKAYALFKG